MNWSRAKTILIFLFLATAIFQLTVLLSSNKKANKLSPDVIASTVEILEKNDITISKKDIPNKNYTLPIVSADNAITDYEEFATKVLGENITSNDKNEFTTSGGMIRFYANRFNYIPSEDITIKTDNIVKSCEDFLNNLGFDLSEFIENHMQNQVEFTNTADRYPIFNSKIKISTNGNRIENAQGTWFNITDKDGHVRLKSITAVLIDLLKSDIQKPAKITKIELGYTVPESDAFQKSVTLIPAWQISFEDGNKILIDARSTQ